MLLGKVYWQVVKRTTRGLNMAERNGPNVLFKNQECSQLVTRFDTCWQWHRRRAAKLKLDIFYENLQPGRLASIRPCYFPESRYELLVFKVHEVDGKLYQHARTNLVRVGLPSRRQKCGSGQSSDSKTPIPESIRSCWGSTNGTLSEKQQEKNKNNL